MITGFPVTTPPWERRSTPSVSPTFENPLSLRAESCSSNRIGSTLNCSNPAGPTFATRWYIKIGISTEERLGVGACRSKGVSAWVRAGPKKFCGSRVFGRTRGFIKAVSRKGSAKRIGVWAVSICAARTRATSDLLNAMQLLHKMQFGRLAEVSASCASRPYVQRQYLLPFAVAPRPGLLST